MLFYGNDLCCLSQTLKPFTYIYILLKNKILKRHELENQAFKFQQENVFTYNYIGKSLQNLY